MSVEAEIEKLARHGDVVIFIHDKGNLYNTRLTIGGFPGDSLVIDSMGCTSVLESINLIHSYFFVDLQPRIPDHTTFVGQNVIEALQGMFPKDSLSINIDNRSWSVLIECDNKDPGSIVMEPTISFRYRAWSADNTFTSLARDIFHRFKIPAEGIVLGPVGMSHRLSG